MKERYTVEISGMELNLLTDESEEYVLGLAKHIDSRINAMVMSSKRCTKIEAALFCCMEYLDDSLKTKLSVDDIREERDNLKIEKDLLTDDNERLKKENDELRAQLSDLRQKYIKS